MHKNEPLLALVLEYFKKKQSKCVDFVKMVLMALKSQKISDQILLKLLKCIIDHCPTISLNDRYEILWGICNADSLTEDFEVDLGTYVDFLLKETDYLPLSFIKVVIK